MRVQKSCPDRSEVNGWFLLLRQLSTPPPPAPSSALTAVPTAMNSAMSEPNSFISTSSRTPTMPSACSARSEEHTSEPSHPSISYAVFCLKKKKQTHNRVKNQLLHSSLG